MEMNEELKKAQVLVEALPYIQKFNRKIIVVKYGGSAMVDEELKRKVIQDVVLLKLVGFKPIIVHGGGKEISKWVEKSGMEPHFLNGLRVTDEPTSDNTLRTLLQRGKLRHIWQMMASRHQCVVIRYLLLSTQQLHAVGSAFESGIKCSPARN